MELQEKLDKRKALAAELEALDADIRESTMLPYGWSIDPGTGHMAGGVTLWGSAIDGEGGSEEEVSICVYGGSQGAGFFIRDHDRGTTSPHVDPEAVKAALRILDLKNKALRKLRETNRPRDVA